MKPHNLEIRCKVPKLLAKVLHHKVRARDPQPHVCAVLVKEDVKQHEQTLQAPPGHSLRKCVDTCGQWLRAPTLAVLGFDSRWSFGGSWNIAILLTGLITLPIVSPTALV